MTETAATHSTANKAKSILSYTFLPGIMPQVREIGRGGFGYLAYLIAVVYHSVRILPANHPYLIPANVGKYGLREVIAAAADNIRFSKRNIDQILIFFAVLSALVILVLQILSFVFMFLTGDAIAQEAIFKLPEGYEETDMAYHMMREVFGIPDMFGPMENGRSALHQGLHILLQFYNLAILLVAVLVFLYYVIVVVAETAQTGVPFGKRFSHIYAPFRLVVAVGLLVPLNYGLNGSQYVTLFAAKIGSNFATNAWIRFNDVVENPTGQENSTLIAESKAPDTVGLVNFMAIAVTCREAYDVSKAAGNSNPIEMYQSEKMPDGTTKITKLGSGGAQSANGVGTQAIEILFGALTDELGDEEGGEEVTALCGKINVPITVPMNGNSRNGTPGKLQRQYLELITGLWNNSQLTTWGRDFAQAQMGSLGADYHPPSEQRDKVLQDTQKSIDAIIKQHYEDARKTDFSMRKEILDLGWGGAAKYYNLIAQVNGAYVVATFNVPVKSKWPSVMEYVLETKRRSDSVFGGCHMFEPNLADNKPITFEGDDDGKYLSRVLYDVYVYWNCHKTKNAANFFIDTIAAIFGLQGLISIREKATGANGQEVDVHPLAKLSVLGRGLVENAVRSLGFAMGASFAGGILGILSPHLGEAGEAASGMFVSIATIGLSIGFLTYYILPFMPFMYFFFALGSWIKSIFEAMVGAPLWALAHLRIDGDGLPGKMADKGYFMIFEIFLRPILTLVGLLGGMAIFTALANTLNEVFDVVVLNTANVKLDKEEDKIFSRHIIDVFFFTVLYAVILYMMAVSSFKMINLVPNSILRWIGTGATSFNDTAPDTALGQLNQYAAIGGAKIGGEVAGAATQLSGAAGKFGAGALKTAGIGGKNT